MVHVCDRCDVECTGDCYTISVQKELSFYHRQLEWCSACVNEVFTRA